MSNSVFKEHPSAEGDNGESKTDSNLFVFINKNGSVSVDHAALQDLLVTDAVESKTSVTVLRVDSPTPSFELELEEEERAKKESEEQLNDEEDNNASDDNDEDDNNDDEDNEKENDTERKRTRKTLTKKDDDIKRVSVTIENFFLPEEAKQLAANILSVAGKTNPLQISVDFEHQLNVIANDHCYTPYTSPSQRKSIDLTATAQTNQRRGSPAGGRPTKSKLLKSTTTTSGNTNQSVTTNADRSADKSPIIKKLTTSTISTAAAAATKTPADETSANEDEDNVSGDEEEEISESDSTYFSPTESDNDRDSDLDFNVNDRPSRVRKITNRNKKQPKQKVLSAKSKKRQQESSLDTSTAVDDSPNNTTLKKRPLKNLKRRPTTSTPIQTNKPTKGAVKSLNKSLTTKSDSESQQKEDISAVAGGSVSLETKPSEQQIKSQPQTQPKKEKKPPAHVEKLYSDMSSLFSTPDIIKKVNQSTTPETPVTTNKSFVMSPVNQSIATTSTTVATLIKQQSQSCDLAIEQDKQLELIDSIVQQELKQESPTKTSSMNDDIPKIVKMLELPAEITNFTTTTAPPLSSSLTTSTTPSTQTIIPTTTSTGSGSLSFAGTIDHELLDDSDLLEGLGNPDDTGLTEDLLQHVAKLVQDKNLQEVIDKQVLGVEPTPTTTQPSTTSSIQPLMLPQQLQQNQLPITKPIESIKSLITANTSKEPIKIIRSNGRVITLPPIEAPTTRGAKRRAQNQPTPDQQKSTNNQNVTPIESNSTAASVTTAAAATKAATPKTSKAKEKRASIASRKLVEITPIKNNDDDDWDDEDYGDEDEDSDGTYNSEDDPNRLWCICRQPHNNRFMICCDKCEEWFHGKCVNVTKAMGMEMEKQGIEWVCPNCLKKQSQPTVQQKPTTPIITQPPPVQKQQPTAPSSSSAKKSKSSSETAVRKTPAKMVTPTKIDTPIIQKSTIVTSAIIATPSPAPSTPPANTPSVLSCIVCKKPARLGSIFCSDDCISKQANVTGFGNASSTQNQKNLSTSSTAELSSTKDKIKTSMSISSMSQVIKHKTSSITTTSATTTATSSSTTPPTTITQTISASKLLKNKNQRVIVMENKTGRILTGNNAPTVGNLKQWLQAHPTFKPIAENSQQATAIKAKQQQIRLAKEMAPAEKILFSVDGQSSPKVQATLKFDSSKRIILVNPSKQQPQNIVIGSGSGGGSGTQRVQQQQTQSQSTPKAITKITKIPAQVSLKPGSPIKSPPQSTTPKSTTTSSATKQSQPPSTQQQTKRKPPVRKNTSPASTTTANESGSHSKSTKPEPIRVNVQRTLKEQIALRCAEEDIHQKQNSTKLTEKEIDKFARDTEAEIYYLFNKDTGAKYRAKYRSLMFNIKDRKNQTLFQKICNKAIDPKQLVRLSPEELASQELALWRENENKHQLEMIKKSELDLLACAKNYVLKTHKGEEVMESKSSDRVTLDPSISVEDVVSVLNNSTVSSTSENLNESNQSPVQIAKDTRIDSRFEKYLSVDSSIATTSTTTTTTSASASAAVNKSNTSLSSTPTTITSAAASSSSSSSSSAIKKKDTHRSRSRDRQKSSSSSSSKHKRKRSRERRSRSRERDKSKSDERSGRDRDRDQSTKSKKDDRKDRERTKSSSSSSVSTKHTNKDNASSGGSTSSSNKPSSAAADTKEPPSKQLKKDDNSHLIDKILDAQSTIDRILGTTSTTTPTTKINESSIDDNTTASSKDGKINKSKDLSIESKPISNENVTTTTIKKSTNSESDQEPSSTVTIPTPPERLLTDDDDDDNDDNDDDEIKSDSDNSTIIWNGTIVMPDVATFQMSMRTFDGNCMSIQNELRSELEVVGRIIPDNVWEYISKIKKTTKEVLVVRLGAETLDDRQAYYELYRCLSTRKRLGVVKSGSSLIKDFYIFPLARHKSMPSVLLPMKSSTAVFEDDRPDLLFGIIVKFSATPASSSSSSSMAKRSSAMTTSSSNQSSQSSSIKVRVAVDLPKIKSKTTALEDDERYTPPTSPKTFVTKSTIHNVPLPVIRKEKAAIEITESPEEPKSDKDKDDDGDEPYSPGGSDDDDIHFIVPPNVTTLPTTPTKSTPLPTKVDISPSQMDSAEITRKMDELNRQIVKSQIEIAGMLLPGSTAAMLANEPYLPTSASEPLSNSIPTLANISFPSNLQEILNSIKNVTTVGGSDATSSSSSSTMVGKSSLTYGKGNAEDDDDDNEYTPAPISSAPRYTTQTIDYIPSKTILTENKNESSKLARLTDEELLSMVPDDADIDLPSTAKKAKYSIEEPPPPGLEDEYVP